MYRQQDTKKCQGPEVGKKTCSGNGKTVWPKYAQQMRKWHEMRPGRQARDKLMPTFLVMVRKLERDTA